MGETVGVISEQNGMVNISINLILATLCSLQRKGEIKIVVQLIKVMIYHYKFVRSALAYKMKELER